MENNEHLTRKQLRDKKRQEKLIAREQSARSQSRQKLIVTGIILVGVVGLGWLIAAAGNGNDGGSGSVDTLADPSQGNPDATVVVKEYSDFQCPACKAAESMVNAVLSQYGEQVRLEYNDFPLRSIHKNAEKAAVAANCVDVEDATTYWEYHAMLFDNQSTWESLSGTELVDTFVGYGEQLSLNADTLRSCITNNETLDRVNEDIREAGRKNINSTPTFFVGDERIVGADQSGLTAAIENALNL